MSGLVVRQCRHGRRLVTTVDTILCSIASPVSVQSTACIILDAGRAVMYFIRYL